MDLSDIWLSLRLLVFVCAYTVAALFSFFGAISLAIVLQELVSR